MTFVELMTSVLVPIASPLVAAIAIVVAIRTEAHKMRLQRLNEHRQRINSIFTDFLYARDLFTILTYQAQLGGTNAAHVAELQVTAGRALDKIFSDPEVGLYDQVQFTGDHNNIFRLLAELRIRIAGLEPGGKLDLLIYFGLTTLLYLYDSDQPRRDGLYAELEKARDTNPKLYENLMVDRNTKSLRSSV